MLYSEQRAQAHKVGWYRAGSRVCYYKNTLGSDKKPYYTLTFSVAFEHSDVTDTCYLAHCFPYTVDDLHCDLRELVTDPARESLIRWGVLTYSLGNRPVSLLTGTTGLIGCAVCRDCLAVS